MSADVDERTWQGKGDFKENSAFSLVSFRFSKMAKQLHLIESYLNTIGLSVLVSYSPHFDPNNVEIGELEPFLQFTD